MTYIYTLISSFFNLFLSLLNSIGNWRNEFLKQSSLPPEEAIHFPMIVIGNKIDINDRVVSRRQARAWAEEHSSDQMQIPCFDASAKDGTNVEKAFRHIAHMVKIPQMELDMNNNDDTSLSLSNQARTSKKSSLCC